MTKADKNQNSQLERFKETARALGCDEDKERFEAALGKIASAHPKDAAGKARDKTKGRPKAQR